MVEREGEGGMLIQKNSVGSAKEWVIIREGLKGLLLKMKLIVARKPDVSEKKREVIFPVKLPFVITMIFKPAYLSRQE